MNDNYKDIIKFWKIPVKDLGQFVNCKQCDLYKTRFNIVIGNGEIPAKILFIGEGPGRSEDTTGIPFFGPSGRMLNKLISASWKLFLDNYKGNNLDMSTLSVRSYGGSWFTKAIILMPTYYITNIVLCRPCDENDEKREPLSHEVLACMYNVKNIITRVQPKIIVFVGKEAERYYKDEYPDGVRITHPAALLRTGGVCSPFYNINIRILNSIYERLYK